MQVSSIVLKSMEAVLQEGGDSEEAMGEDHCHHGPSLVAPSPSDGRYSYLHPSLNKIYLSLICIYSVSQPADTESVTAGVQDLQLGHGNYCLAINFINGNFSIRNSTSSSTNIDKVDRRGSRKK